MRDIAICGAGGYGREIACLIKKINDRNPKWNFIGYCDDNKQLHGKDNVYGKIIGDVELLNSWEKPLDVVIAIASSKSLINITKQIINPNIEYPNILDPDISYLDSETFYIGKGNIIGYGCRFSCNVNIGDFNILINASTFGHDVKIGNYNVLFPETRLAGLVEVGNENFFGMRSAVLQGFKIGNKTRIAAGSFVMRNTKDGFLYSGNPARRIEL